MSESSDAFEGEMEAANKRMKRRARKVSFIMMLVTAIYMGSSVYQIYGIYVKGVERQWQQYISMGEAVSAVCNFSMCFIFSWLSMLRAVRSLIWRTSPVAGGMVWRETALGSASGYVVRVRASSVSSWHCCVYGFLCVLPLLLFPWWERVAPDNTATLVFCGVAVMLPVLMFFGLAVAIARGGYDICIDSQAGVVNLPISQPVFSPESLYKVISGAPRVVPLKSIRRFKAEIPSTALASSSLQIEFRNGVNSILVLYSNSHTLMDGTRLQALTDWLNEKLDAARTVAGIEPEPEDGTDDDDPSGAANFSLNPTLPPADGVRRHEDPLAAIRPVLERMDKERRASDNSLLSISSLFAMGSACILAWMAYTIYQISMLGAEHQWHAFIPTDDLMLLQAAYLTVYVLGWWRLLSVVRYLLGMAPRKNGPGEMQWSETSGQFWLRLSTVSWGHLAVYVLLVCSPLLLMPWWAPLPEKSEETPLQGIVFTIAIFTAFTVPRIVALSRGKYDIIADYEEGTLSVPCYEFMNLSALVVGPARRVIPLHAARSFVSIPGPLPRLVLHLGQDQPFVLLVHYSPDTRYSEINFPALAEWLNDKLHLDPGFGGGGDGGDDVTPATPPVGSNRALITSGRS
jgi:hypothetical protein